MVKNCSNKYPKENEELYKPHFDRFSFPLSDFQKHSIEAIVTGNHALITAHTGSGKTLPAEFAIQHFVEQGKRLIYTSPIKALSNQKYYEFTKKYPDITFGLFTGDIKTNPEANVLIMTTEILMNYLFTSLNTNTKDSEKNKNSLLFQIDVNTELACVVFDEVHYINDKERGQTWEKTILMLPEHVQMVMLSATIDNPEGFALWCERGLSNKQVYLATTNHRVVPLHHYGFLTTTEAVFKTIKDKTVQQYIRDNTNTLIPIRNPKGEFDESGYRNIAKLNKIFETNQFRMNRKHVLNQLAIFLREREMLPAIAFVFSRKHVETCASDITVPLLEFDSKVAYTVRHECEQIVRKLPNFKEYMELPEYNRLVSLLEKGIGIHHSGMIPILREIVEIMISKKYIKLLFATESFAIGLDCPIRTAVFTSLKKFDGNDERYLYAHEYGQMAGRAGRRGIDTVGYVVQCNNLFVLPSIPDCKQILCGKPQQLVSKYHISYNLILNLLKNGQNAGFSEFSKKSMIFNEINQFKTAEMESLKEVEDKISKKMDIIGAAKTPRDICERHIYLEDNIKTFVNKKRKEAEREKSSIEESHKFLTNDVKNIRELVLLEKDLDSLRNSVEYADSFISKHTDNICEIMKQKGFINYVDVDAADSDSDSGYQLTMLGKVASNLAEIHPLILSKCMFEWNNYESFTPKQLVGLFSCFTDVKVPDDIRISRPNIADSHLQSKIIELEEQYNEYRKTESEFQLNTGINYDSALNFDIIELSMSWCDCETEIECKSFIQNEVAAKTISIGDFTKAMLKIVTITNEFVNICEDISDVNLLHKLNQIERMILKYVATSQSLYV